MTGLRRIAYVGHLARRRLSGRPVLALVACGGVALAAAAFAATLGGGLLVQDRNVADRFASLAPTERAVAVTHFGVLPGRASYGAVDAAARHAAVALTGSEPARVVQLKELRLGRARAVLVGIDDPGRFVRLERGRLPRRCTRARCELLAVRGSVPLGRLDGRFSVVGRARLAADAPVTAFAAPSGSSSETLGADEPAAVLVAAGARGLSELPALSSIYRTYGWVAPLGHDEVRVWKVDALARELARQRNSLRAVSDGFDVTAPVAELLEARHEGRVAEGRLLLVGGEAACLLLAFAVFVAATMRRRERAAWLRLTWFGARRWQIVLLATLQAVLLAGVGAVAGWALGAAATAAIGRAAGLPAGDLVAHALLTGERLVVCAALAAAATVALVATLLVSRVGVGGRSFSTLDMAALAALAVLVLVLVSDRTASGSSGALLLVPGLALFVAAYLASRLLVPLTRALQRPLGRSSFPLRLAALSIARLPGQATVAVAFLVVSVGLAVFALLYVTTLERGVDDQAAYRVPFDLTVREKLAPRGLVPPLRLAPLGRYASLAPGTRAIPVIRRTGSVSNIARTTELTAIGLPARELPRLEGWRRDFSPASAGTLAARLRPGATPALRGVDVPPGTTELVLPVRVTGDDVHVLGAFVGRDGGFVTADFGRTHGARRSELRARVGRRLAGARLVGLRFRRLLEVEAHAQGAAPILRGVAIVGPLRARGGGDRAATLVRSYRDWLGVGGARAAPAFGPNAVDYLVSEAAEAFFRLRQPTDEHLIPAVVSPELAALADARSRLAVQVPAGTLALQIVGTARHFPTVTGPVVAADEDELAVALHTLAPGAGTADEVWLDTPSPAAAATAERALARTPFDVLDVDSRARARHELEDDPLTRGTIAVLLGAMATALLFGALAVFFLAETDARDGGGELLDLEIQGAGPDELRRHLRLRLALVALPGVVGGTLAGLALSRVVVDAVELTARADEPPLVLHANWALTVLTPAVLLLVAGALAVARTRSAFAAPYAAEEGA